MAEVVAAIIMYFMASLSGPIVKTYEASGVIFSFKGHYIPSTKFP